MFTDSLILMYYSTTIFAQKDNLTVWKNCCNRSICQNERHQIKKVCRSRPSSNDLSRASKSKFVKDLQNISVSKRKKSSFTLENNVSKAYSTCSGRVMIKTPFTSGHGELQSVTVEFDKNVPRTAKRFRFNYQWDQQKERLQKITSSTSFKFSDCWLLSFRGSLHHLLNSNSSGLERVIHFHSREHKTVTTSKYVPQAWIYWREQRVASALVSIMQNTN